MRAAFLKKGKIGWLDKLLRKEYGSALQSVTINGNQVQSAKDCDMILRCVELDELRAKALCLCPSFLRPAKASLPPQAKPQKNEKCLAGGQA